MAVSKEKKVRDFQALKDGLKNAKSVLVFENPGFTFESQQNLRKDVRDKGGRMIVPKNTLVKMAFKEVFEEEVDLEGTNVLAFGLEDEVEVIKTVFDRSKDKIQPFVFKFGVFEGKLKTAEEMLQVATLPSREDLMWKIAYLINSPVQTLARMVNAPATKIAYGLKAYQEKLA